MSRDRNAEEDEPVEQMLRVVDVLDCVPGYTETDDKEPITILTLGHMGEIEQPLLINLKDTERLLARMLVSLASHGNQWAKWVLDTFYKRVSDGPQRATASSRAPTPADPILLHVKPPGGRQKIALKILGGYRAVGKALLLYRAGVHSGSRHLDAVAELHDKRVISLCASGHAALPQRLWSGFCRLAEGKQFRFNGLSCQKLTLAELRDLLVGRVYRIKR